MLDNGLHLIGDVKTNSSLFIKDALVAATAQESGAWATYSSMLILTNSFGMRFGIAAGGGWRTPPAPGLLPDAHEDQTPHPRWASRPLPLPTSLASLHYRWDQRQGPGRCTSCFKSA